MLKWNCFLTYQYFKTVCYLGVSGNKSPVTVRIFIGGKKFMDREIWRATVSDQIRSDQSLSRLQFTGLQRVGHSWVTKPYLLGEGYTQERTELKLHFGHSLWVSMLGLQESSHSLHCAQLSPNERCENWKKNKFVWLLWSLVTEN